MTKSNRKVLIFTDLPLYYSKRINVWIAIFNIISGVCAVGQIYVVSHFIDTALSIVHKEIWNREAIWALIFLFLTVTVDWLVPRITGLLRQKAELALAESYRPLLLKKCAALKYGYVEDPNSWDLLSRILKEPEKRWMDIYEAILSLLKLAISIIGMLFVIAGYVWWAALVILAFCIPLFVLSVKGGKKNYQAQRDASEYSRKYYYFDNILNSRECLDERKLFGYSDKINEMYADAYGKAFWIETKTNIYWAFKTKLSGGLSMIAALLIVVTLIQPTLSGEITIGMFISLVNAVFLLTSQMSWGLSCNIDVLVNGNEFCKDMRKFWDLEDDSEYLELPKYVSDIKKIEFKNVHFRYPNSDFEVLKGVSFTMDAGRKYALVGSNGAGKTTIIKLLTGLYSDYEGEILINGKELRKYSKAEQKGIFAVVYQDFVRHALSFRENCDIADLCRNISDTEIEALFKRFELDKVVDSYPNGLDTCLGKIKDGGVDLSGGQWQKLVMIRALLRPAEVCVLDEPTASLDPKMESEIYRMFQEMSEDKLTILISHRLGFAKLADTIFVFADGIVKEQGDFVALMGKKGLFFKMYEEQRGWYE